MGKDGEGAVGFGIKPLALLVFGVQVMMGMPGLEKETMQAGSIAASMCLCLTLLTACAFTKRFEPTTTDEHAIVDTIASFLAAYRAEDYATISDLTTPEATLRADHASPQNLREGIVTLRSDEAASALLQVTPKTLVNFQHPSSDSASVESYVHASTDRGFDNTQIKWELVRREHQWLILAMTTDAWTVSLHSQGGGP
jgi:hypothetical protein